MSAEIIKVLDDLARRFGIAIDWTDQNVLPYAQELANKYVMYRQWNAVMYIALFVIMAISVFIIAYRCFKSGDSDYEFLSFIVVGIGSPICLIGLCCNIHTIIVCNTFPEMLIMEYVKQLIGK